MNIDLSWWGRLVGLLAAEALLVVSVAGLAARVLRSPQSQRTVWQAALLGIAILWVGECADARHHLARFLPLEDPIRRLSAHVLDSLPGESLNDGVPEEPRAIPSPAALQAGPVWWPGELWLAGFALLMARLVLIRAGLAWCVLRLRRKDRCSEQQQGGSPSLPYDPTSAESPNAEWITDRLCLPLGLPRVRVLVWPRLRGPVAFSVFCPTVALPEDFDQRFTPVQREAMLAHELAHLTARDPMWLALTDFVCALAWWHPAIWWAPCDTWPPND